MKQRSLSALLATAVVAIPAGAVWVATRPSSTGSATAARATATATPRPGKSASHKTKTTAHKSTSHKAPATRKYTGPVEDMQWGPVQVTITVKGKKITDVQATAPMERPRSAFINEQAIPMLRQEVLQAQSGNIDAIGGATMTSEAFYLSLEAALTNAHLKG
jgi:uncharacterized protein with FMN-binding domain